jgi:hypothetical protein
MSYTVGHWSHFSGCFAAFPHGRVETLRHAMAACAVEREDVPMVESRGDVAPRKVDPLEAAEVLAELQAAVDREVKYGEPEDRAIAAAWLQASREPEHGRRAGLQAAAERLGAPPRWSATEALSQCVQAVTYCAPSPARGA